MCIRDRAGREHVLNAYKEAVEERYRFFSFGDAMFITNDMHTVSYTHLFYVCRKNRGYGGMVFEYTGFHTQGGVGG